MRVRVVKPFRYGLHVFQVGEVGTVLDISVVEHPLTWQGRQVYDYYVKVGGYQPVGVQKDEIEFIGERG